MDVIQLLAALSLVLKLTAGLDNLALSKTASQSSNLYEEKWLADTAVDGNGNQKLNGNSCACTKTYQKTVWWQVDLGNVYAVSTVKTFYRNEGTGYTFRLSGFKLYVTLQDDFLDSSPVYVNNNGQQNQPFPPANFTVTVATYGRYVTLYKNRSGSCREPFINENVCALFELCEVEVLGCPKTKYGTDCQSTCPVNCLYDVCAISNGNCYGCTVGYNGDKCDQPCSPGTYGVGCAKSCSGNCKDGVTCDVRVGTCPSGCSPGYTGVYCNQTCSSGNFGPSCASKCGSCRNNVTCNYINGSCSNGCDLGFTGQYCKTDCSPEKYGYDCKENCSGNCLNGVTCNDKTGQCNNGCAAGWKGDKCNTVCDNGMYGPNCKYNCTGNCANETYCSRIDGSCQFGCKSGWKGNICNQVCANGTYGSGCLLFCGNCINSTICDRRTGVCGQGCDDGYKEKLCIDKCDSGYYGPNCSLVCGPCNNTCHHVTGVCSDSIPVVQIPQKSDSTTAIAAGVSATFLVIIIAIVVVVLVFRMRRQTKETVRKYSQRIQSKRKYANSMDDNDNPAGPSDVYAEVDKSRNKAQAKKDVTSVPSDVYAEVDKSNKTSKSPANETDDGQGSVLYAEVEKKPEKKKGKKAPTPKEPERHINEEGLVYIDVEFTNPSQKQTKWKNIDDRTEYASLEIQ